MKVIALWAFILVCIAALPACDSIESISFSGGFQKASASTVIHFREPDHKQIKKPVSILHEPLFDRGNVRVEPIAGR